MRLADLVQHLVQRGFEIGETGLVDVELFRGQLDLGAAFGHLLFLRLQQVTFLLQRLQHRLGGFAELVGQRPRRQLRRQFLAGGGGGAGGGNEGRTLVAATLGMGEDGGGGAQHAGDGEGGEQEQDRAGTFHASRLRTLSKKLRTSSSLPLSAATPAGGSAGLRWLRKDTP